MLVFSDSRSVRSGETGEKKLILSYRNCRYNCIRYGVWYGNRMRGHLMLGSLRYLLLYGKGKGEIHGTADAHGKQCLRLSGQHCILNHQISHNISSFHTLSKSVHLLIEIWAVIHSF